MLIFLDIDGVLNSVAWIGGGCVRGSIPPTFAEDALVEELLDPSCVARLRQIVEVTGAKIVLSSSWRHWMSLEELAKLLGFHGFTDAPIVGVTPDLPGPRGAQVQAWLERNASRETAFVCIDDDGDFYESQPLIRTDPEVGLSDRNATACIHVLTNSRQLKDLK
jgi:hypothetical protein